MIIAAFTMLVIMALDKLLLGHSHDHEYEISFVAEPKRSEEGRSVELRRRTGELVGGEENVGSERQGEEHEHDHGSRETEKEKEKLREGAATAINWKPFVLQLGMSIHAFF